MPALSVLFLGGTGTISAACAAAAVEHGLDLTVMTRGASTERAIPDGVRRITGDASDAGSLTQALGGREFDVVVDFIAYRPEQAHRDIEVFAGRTGQYVYISSASVYEKPPRRLPITESTPLRNPYWQYSRDKIASELVLQEAFRDTGFPVTIVRPSHTYDQTRIPLAGGWTVIDRMRRGRPIVVHGDGTSLWTLTHSSDFARGLVPLLGDPRVIGDSIHITSHEVLDWNQITRIMGDAAGATPEIVHVTSRELVTELPDMEGLHLGDRTWSHLFDTAKLRSLVPQFAATTPFAEGARQIIDWHDADPSRRVVDPELDAAFDRLVAAAR